MAFVPTANCASLFADFLMDGQFVQIGCDFTGAGSDPAVLATAAATFYGAIHDAILPLLSNQVQLDSTVAIDQTTFDGPVGIFVGPGTDVGGVADNPAPSNVAFCVTKLTAGRGRGARGRWYLPGIPKEKFIGQSELDTTYVNSLVAGSNDVLSAMATANFFGAVVSRQLNKVDRVAGLVRPITAFRAYDNVVDSQRRRLPGRGR